jgi:hypothetical protein
MKSSVSRRCRVGESHRRRGRLCGGPCVCGETGGAWQGEGSLLVRASFDLMRCSPLIGHRPRNLLRSDDPLGPALNLEHSENTNRLKAVPVFSSQSGVNASHSVRRHALSAALTKSFSSCYHRPPRVLGACATVGTDFRGLTVSDATVT